MLLLLALACRDMPTEELPADDLDGDGVARPKDCDDENPHRHPGAIEVCDGSDQDCDGLVDEGVTVIGYHDSDGDGHGVATPYSIGCQIPEGYAPQDDDCDDANSTVFPGAPESCNGDDDDCDQEVDEAGAEGETEWFVDADGDGYGSTSVWACNQPGGTSVDSGDCDDDSAAYNPGATEACDEPTDYNCDGSVGFADNDADGFAACLECRDDDAAVNPGAVESCNGTDDDCDGEADEPGAEGETEWYVDGDGDGYGSASTLACDTPAGHVEVDGDCDDTDAGAHPDGTETCNGIDDDCDGNVDESSADADTWYADNDGDGHGDASASVASCDAPAGHVAAGDDCDDTDATVSPSARESCNAVDDDCDGAVDQGENALGGAWRDDFDDNDISDWTVLGGGWSASGGVVTGYSTSHIGPDFVRSTPMDGSEDSYTLVTRAMGNHDMGLVLAYADPSNYCGFHLLQGLDLYLTTGNNVEEVVGTAAHDALSYYELRAELSPEHVDLYLDGLLIFSDDASCDDFVRTGDIGLQVHQDHLAYFDELCVEW